MYIYNKNNMSSINTPTKFQIKLKEEHVVKGIKTLNETFFTLGNITNVDRRIVTVPGSTNIHLFDVNGVLPAAGTFPSSSMKYARISNLDTSSSLAVNGLPLVEIKRISSWSSDLHSKVFAPIFSQDEKINNIIKIKK